MYSGRCGAGAETECKILFARFRNIALKIILLHFFFFFDFLIINFTRRAVVTSGNIIVFFFVFDMRPTRRRPTTQPAGRQKPVIVIGADKRTVEIIQYTAL